MLAPSLVLLNILPLNTLSYIEIAGQFRIISHWDGRVDHQSIEENLQRSTLCPMEEIIKDKRYAQIRRPQVRLSERRTTNRGALRGWIRFVVLPALIVGCDSADQIGKDAESVHKSYLKKTTIVIKPIGRDSSEVIKADTSDMSDSIIVLLKRAGLNWKSPPTYSGSLHEGMVQKNFSCLESALIFQFHNHRTAVDTVIVYGDAKSIEVMHSDHGWKLFRAISGNVVVDEFLKTSKAI